MHVNLNIWTFSVFLWAKPDGLLLSSLGAWKQLVDYSNSESMNTSYHLCKYASLQGILRWDVQEN